MDLDRPKLDLKQETASRAVPSTAGTTSATTDPLSASESTSAAPDVRPKKTVTRSTTSKKVPRSKLKMTDMGSVDPKNRFHGKLQKSHRNREASSHSHEVKRATSSKGKVFVEPTPVLTTQARGKRTHTTTAARSTHVLGHDMFYSSRGQAFETKTSTSTALAYRQPKLEVLELHASNATTEITPHSSSYDIESDDNTQIEDEDYEANLDLAIPSLSIKEATDPFLESMGEMPSFGETSHVDSDSEQPLYSFSEGSPPTELTSTSPLLFDSNTSPPSGLHTSSCTALESEISIENLSVNNTPTSLPPPTTGSSHTTTTRQTTSRYRSEVWDNFEKIGDGRLARCKLCRKEVSRGRQMAHLTNSGMTAHFNRHHQPIVLKGERAVVAPSDTATTSSVVKGQGIQTKIPVSVSGLRSTLKTSKSTQPTLHHFGPFRSGRLSRQQTVTLTRLIAELIAVGGLPFSLAEMKPFKTFVAFVAPQYKIPARTTFSRTVVPSLYRSCVALVKEELKQTAGHSVTVHFTTDIWSAPSGQHAFLSLTGHWWHPNVSVSAPAAGKSTQGYRSFLLHVEVMDVEHKAENIMEALKKMLQRWLGERAGTDAQMGWVVSDGAKNMFKALRTGGLSGVWCTAHIIHLIVKGALDQESNGRVIELLKSCRKVAGHFHRSVKASELLRVAQEKKNVAQHQLKQDVPTRWNSTLAMLERILEQKKVIHELTFQCKIGIENPFGVDEWSIIAQLIAVLRPFYDVTILLSKDTASICQVLVFFDYLKDRLDGFLSGSDPLPGDRRFPAVDTLIRTLQVNLEKRTREQIDHCPALMLAAMCDPRLKTKMPQKLAQLPKWKNILIDLVQKEERKRNSPLEAEEAEEEEGEVHPSTSGSSGYVESSTSGSSGYVEYSGCDSVLYKVYGGAAKKAKGGRQTNASEAVQDYLSSPVTPGDTDVLQYWFANADKWPALSQLARRLLSCPPTTVQSERTFSVSGNIMTPHRSRLTPRLMEQLTFLQVNVPKLGYPTLAFESEC